MRGAFNCSTMESMRNKNENLSKLLGMVSQSAKTAYEGAVYVINAEEHADKWAQYAHSLRESIDIVARKNVKKKDRKYGWRKKGLQLFVPGNESKKASCARLAGMYRMLSKIAHHNYHPKEPIDKYFANNVLTLAENDLITILAADVEDMRSMR